MRIVIMFRVYMRFWIDVESSQVYISHQFFLFGVPPVKVEFEQHIATEL